MWYQWDQFHQASSTEVGIVRKSKCCVTSVLHVTASQMLNLEGKSGCEGALGSVEVGADGSVLLFSDRFSLHFLIQNPRLRVSWPS